MGIGVPILGIPNFKLILVVWLCFLVVEIIPFSSRTLSERITVFLPRLVAVEIWDTEILSSFFRQPQVFLMIDISTRNSEDFSSCKYLSKIMLGMGINPFSDMGAVKI